MENGLGHYVHHNIGNATGATGQERQVPSFNYARDEAHSTEWNFGPGPRKPPQELPSINAYDRAPFNTSQQSLTAPTSGRARVSLAPRNIYNQQDIESRTIDNADNHFRFTQNLRQGEAINQTTPAPLNPQPVDTIAQHNNNMLFQRQNNSVVASPISQLANAMLFDRPMSQALSAPNPVNFFQNIHASRLNQLQPQRQQVTPPFNLSGFTYSPNPQQAAKSSSPVAGQASSPTARISLRRAISRAPLTHSYSEAEGDYTEERAPPKTPQRYSLPALKQPPQVLALGHSPPMARGIQLISPHELPDRFRQVFPYELFNAAQSKCFVPIYKTNDNVVVSAPTGSGKTAILELAICKLVEGHRSGEFKIVYQAPTKSLCSERLRDWEKKFSHLDLLCAELTGDTDQKEMTKVRNASIIITTPEKWDSITRKWTDHDRLVQMVKLFLIDEVHFLKESRGATLEAVVSRMKSRGSDVRFVALSATVPNSHDIAVWLGKDPVNRNLPAHRETFGEDFRPVKLRRHVYGFDGQMNDFAFEKVLDGKLQNLIQKHTHKKPTMVFCFTRKSCENTAALLAEWWTRQRAVDRAWPAPTQRVVVGSKQLEELVGCGVAFHHAGLDPQDRHAIEGGYLKGDISLICCTSTLAVGVNLPCHLVVLKGTVGYQDGILGEYSDLEVMQMLGRAGRPQFDDSAVAVIMTRSDKLDRYKKMISGQDILESTLHLNLIEHLNSEIGLDTVRNVNSAKEWLKGTFLSVRMRQNPNHYKIEGVAATRDTDHRLELVCERDIKLLQEHQLITDAEKLSCTEYGHAMSRYMVQFETMKLLLRIPRQAKTDQILNIICQASEFKDLRMKPSERAHLREFNKSPFIKYPIKDNISTTSHKISLIVQVQLGGIEYPNDKDFNVVRRQFGTEKSIIFDRINRLIRCVVDCKLYDCDAISTRHALDLARSLSAEFWESSNLQLRQIPGVGPAGVRKFVTSNVNSVEKLAALSTGEIERYMSKNPPYGRKLLDQLVGFPRLKLDAQIVARTFKAGTKPKINVMATLSYDNDKVPIWKSKKPSLTFVAETSDGSLVHFWRGNILKLETNCEIKFTVELSAPSEEIRCHVACEEIVGTIRSKIIKPEIPASAFTQPPRNEGGLQIHPVNKKSNTDDSDEFGGNGIGDDDFLAAVKGVDSSVNEYSSDDFADIDDFENEKGDRSMKKARFSKILESVQMANGKWTCNHPCRGGQLLKTGQACKHRCCHEGLDKPRKARTKFTAGAGSQRASDNREGGKADDEQLSKKSPSKGSRADGNNLPALSTNPQAVGTNPKAMKSKSNKEISKLKPKQNKGGDSDLDSVELVDLADEPPLVSYRNLSPHDYRRLYTLHTNVQEDKSVRLPKRNPQFSYSSGERPKPPRSHKQGEVDDLFDDGGIEDDDLPSPSRLFPGGGSSDIHGPLELGTIVNQREVPASSFFDESLEGLEAGMIGLSDSVMLRQTTPKVSSSFANDVFDFDAFGVQSGTPMALKRTILPSPSPREPQKRELSSSLELQPPKHRRVSKEKAAEQSAQASSSAPSWVDEFDADLIDGLRGFVEFVD